MDFLIINTIKFETHEKDFFTFYFNGFRSHY